MTTNKPGSVNQQPLYGCTGCYEDYTWPACDLRAHDGECWCDLCWGERRWEFPDLPYWDDLEPYTPALQAERDALQAECEELRELLRESLESFTCSDTGDDFEDSHRCGRCDEYVDRNAKLRMKIRAALSQPGIALHQTDHRPDAMLPGHPSPAPQPLTDEHKDILKECCNQAMRWTLEARIPECGAFSRIAQDLDYLCEQLGVKND